MIIVIQPCTCAVRCRLEVWIVANARIASVASARSAGWVMTTWGSGWIDSAGWNGASRYFEAANAEAAIGPAKPIRNETHPVRNAASGP